jgi:hypothetical protein
VFPVRYEYHLHMKKVKLSPYQAAEAHRYVPCEVRTLSIYKEVTLSPYQVAEVHRCVT